jgi:FG-GAP repeat
MGTSVAGAGDFNGDGHDDVLVSAPATMESLYLQGAIWLFYVQKPQPGRPKRTVRPHIVGVPRAGQTLRCAAGTWTGGKISFAYGWYRDSKSDRAPVAARDLRRYGGRTHLLASDDVGHVFSCVVAVTGTGGTGIGRSAAVLVRP